MRIETTRDFDLEAFMGHEVLRAERAVTKGVGAAGKGLRRAWRAQVRAALGYRMAGAIRSRTYPERTESLNAASLVYAPSRAGGKAPYRSSAEQSASASDVILAHDRGAVIRSTRGFYLAIPLAAAARMRGATTTGRGDRTRITPGGYERRTGRRLRFVYRPGRHSLLVDDGTPAPGNIMLWRGGRRAGYRTPRGFKNRTIPVFLLVPQVKLRKKTDLHRETQAWNGRLPGLILRNWPDGGR